METSTAGTNRLQMREDTETVWKAAQDVDESTEKYLIEFQKEENKESVEKEHWKRSWLKIFHN